MASGLETYLAEVVGRAHCPDEFINWAGDANANLSRDILILRITKLVEWIQASQADIRGLGELLDVLMRYAKEFDAMHILRECDAIAREAMEKRDA